MLESLAPEHKFTLALTESPHRDLSMLDVLAPGVNKGTALAEWARLRGVPRENVMAIGDNWNDREMLEYAGLPIVMGNAIPELKTLGWSVTGTNDDCGVAEAIYRHRSAGRHRRLTTIQGGNVMKLLTRMGVLLLSCTIAGSAALAQQGGPAVVRRASRPRRLSRPRCNSNYRLWSAKL